jgi:hypothetical protein
MNSAEFHAEALLEARRTLNYMRSDYNDLLAHFDATSVFLARYAGLRSKDVAIKTAVISAAELAKVSKPISTFVMTSDKLWTCAVMWVSNSGQTTSVCRSSMTKTCAEAEAFALLMTTLDGSDPEPATSEKPFLSQRELTAILVSYIRDHNCDIPESYVIKRELRTHGHHFDKRTFTNSLYAARRQFHNLSSKQHSHRAPRTDV